MKDMRGMMTIMKYMRAHMRKHMMNSTSANMVIAIAIVLMNILLFPAYSMGSTIVKVVDSISKKPIKDAIVTSGNTVVLTDKNGTVTVNTPAGNSPNNSASNHPNNPAGNPANNPPNKIAVRAYGYARDDRIITTPNNAAPLEISLKPFVPRGLYLSFYGIGDRKKRQAALDLIEHTELNTLVIDVKGDRGFINYKSSVALASKIGAQKIITVRDVNGLIKTLKEKGVYLIARIVVFKDNPLAEAKPDLAVKTKGGATWRDRESLAWVDPFKKEVWEYNIDIAEEAAKLGFDEIQFDYLRFPDKKSLKFSKPSTEANRTQAISEFLQGAKKRLEPYNVFLNADIFGYVCWNTDDTQIGQRIEDVVARVDYISPMLYPSGFQYGIPGYRNPVANPNEIVYLSLKRAVDRTHIQSNRFRPWLQAFRDYAYDRRQFKSGEIKAQINAAEKIGSDGWMLWNPRNNYSHDGLKNKATSPENIPGSANIPAANSPTAANPPGSLYSLKPKTGG